MEPNHVKEFTIKKIIDGSTFIVELDLDVNVTIVKKIKLINIKCHSTDVAKGIESKKFVEEFLKDKKLFARTYKDKFGQYNTILCVVYAKNGSGYINLNDELIRKEFAYHIRDNGSPDKRIV